MPRLEILRCAVLPMHPDCPVCSSLVVSKVFPYTISRLGAGGEIAWE